MIRGIIRQSMHFRYLVLVAAATVMLFGIVQLPNMPVDVLPEFAPTYVEIQTEALGLSAEEVEQLITVPLEQDLLNGVAWLETIRSESVPGLSSVVIFFEPGTDLYRARQMVAERLVQAVALPNVSKPPTMLQPLSSSGRFMMVGLSSEDLSLIELSVLARWTIGPRLLGVPGVANVAIWGQRERQLQVQVDPEELLEYGITLSSVVETTGNALWVSPLSFLEASVPGTGGFIDTPQQRLGIWHVLPISSPEELAEVPVKGTAYRLGDVATVVEDHQPLIGDALIDNTTNVLLVVEKLPGINTLDVTRDVEEALAAMQPGLPGVQIDTSLYRPASFIETTMNNLTRTVLIAALLIVLVVFAFLYNWRVVLISLIAIPLSLIAALLVLYLRGETFNALVFGGLVIALAAVIDDAITDPQNIFRRLAERRNADSEVSGEEVILDAATETRNPLFFGTLMLLLAIMPVFFVEGVTGSFFRPLAVTYALAVLASLVVALMVTPALSMIFLGNASPTRRQFSLITKIQEGYGRMISGTIIGRGLMYASIAIGLVILIAGGFLVQPDLVPSYEEVDLRIHMDGPAGTSHPEMVRMISQVNNDLQGIPGVQNAGAHVGRAVFGDQVVGINSSELWVSIDPNANYDATIAAIEETVAGFPGYEFSLESYLGGASSDVLAEPGPPIVVRVFGESMEVLPTVAQDLSQVLSGIEGLSDMNVILPVEEATLEIQVDLDAAQSFGVKPGDVRRAAAILLSGLQVGNLYEEQKVFEVVVWSTPNTRHSVSDVENLLIDTPGGGHVRLSEVADVRIASSPNVIVREGVSPYIDIVANVDGRGVGAVVQDIDNALQGVQFPLEYHAEVLSDYQAQQTARISLIVAIIVALVGIYLFMQAAFESWKLAAMALLALPVALAGGILAIWIFSGGTLSLGGIAGLFALFGLATRTVVMTIGYYRNLELDGEAFSTDLVVRGSVERFTPLIATTLVIAAAFLPFVVFGAIPGHEIANPMGIVILVGLISLAFLNLFVIPPLYMRFSARPAEDEETVIVEEPEPVPAS